MKFVCERCHTKYSIADDKVRGKVLKVRCKTCTNVITVRETGATIDDAGASGQREAPVAKSGSFDAGAAPTVANASAVAKAAARSAKPAPLPAEALFSPGTPAAAPPARRPTPPPMPPLDDVEWYLAVDGAQTGPFPRARLVDKILIQPREADVHIWNASFGDAWKPPKDVAEVEADLRRRRAAAAPVPPPPVRRPTGPLPTVAAAPAVADHSGGHAAGAKKNGVGPAAATASAAATVVAPAPDPAKFGLGDLLGDVDTGVTPPPSAAAAALAARGAAGPGLFDPQTMLTPPPAGGHAHGAAAKATMAVPVGAAAAAMAMPALAGAPSAAIGAMPSVAISAARGKPVKLLLGAAAVVAVVCGIVLFWMFRKPTTSVAAAPPPAAAKPSGTDFAGMAEKLAAEEAAKTPPPPPPPAEGPAVVDVKSGAKVEPLKPGKNNKKQNHKSTAPPPLSPTSPTSPPNLTADQRAAASRFGESTGRELRVPTNNSGSAVKSTPAQADISRVINNNRQGIQTCYQRALLRDNTLTHGKVTVRVSIGLSGKVKSVSLDAPAQFRALEPCIRDVMSRWAFPPSSEEYGTEFPVVLQGNN